MQSFTLPPSSPVLIGGSRALVHSLPAGLACSNFTHAITRAGYSVRVGCATGADHIAMSAAIQYPPGALSVFAAFSQGGGGSFSGSAVVTVHHAENLGHPVSWLAGGPLSVPLVARLMQRSLAALQGCGAAVFFSPGVGSLKVARAALRQGVPVLVCQVGMSAAPVLPIAPVVVSWFGLSFWLYSPTSQPALF